MAEPSNEEIIRGISQSFSIELSPGITLDEIRQKLSGYINHLILHDFSGLVQLLYRIDVSESKLKQYLRDYRDADAALIIADLIIERQIQKIKTRESFRKKGSQETDKDEMWE